MCLSSSISLKTNPQGLFNLPQLQSLSDTRTLHSNTAWQVFPQHWKYIHLPIQQQKYSLSFTSNLCLSNKPEMCTYVHMWLAIVVHCQIMLHCVVAPATPLCQRCGFTEINEVLFSSCWIRQWMKYTCKPLCFYSDTVAQSSLSRLTLNKQKQHRHHNKQTLLHLASYRSITHTQITNAYLYTHHYLSICV